jgi:hypothetical protein
MRCCPRRGVRPRRSSCWGGDSSCQMGTVDVGAMGLGSERPPSGAMGGPKVPDRTKPVARVIGLGAVGVGTLFTVVGLLASRHWAAPQTTWAAMASVATVTAAVVGIWTLVSLRQDSRDRPRPVMIAEMHPGVLSDRILVAGPGRPADHCLGQARPRGHLGDCEDLRPSGHGSGPSGRRRDGRVPDHVVKSVSNLIP